MSEPKLKGYRKTLALIVGLVIVGILNWFGKMASVDAAKVYIFLYLFFMGGNSVEHMDVPGIVNMLMSLIAKRKK